ncbi:hypothetical protein [Mycolicibacterium hippocampi]|uniref:Uncharacterized protein n=1 Tax=Mycolicibacterium hippocampi TaxID=659824 RepID=A0A7I9ZRM2_9MYCO|nr:hypothetical protein [Mycolicibacterium hippocampi]GFH03684.1 hypothetical protein MHIP_41670 [Mycolicibacterium hippocampi]
MVWEKHVGRVGALAVALGIGSAVVAMPGVAWAQPEGSSSASASDSDAGSSRGEAKAGDKPSRPTKSRDAAGAGTSTAADSDAETDDAESETDDAESDEAESDDAETDDTQPDDEATEAEAETSASDPVEPTDRRRSGIEKRAAKDEPEAENVVPEEDGSPPDATNTGDTATPASPPAAESPTADADDLATAEPAEQTPAPATALKSLSAPGNLSSTSDEPAAPDASPLLLTLLASVWRPLAERIAEANTTATTASAVQATGEVQAGATSSPIPGTAYQSPVIGPDGTLYQVTSGGSTTQVSILDSDGQVIATSDEIRGVSAPYGRAAMRPDGTLIVVTTTNRRTNTIISAVDSEGKVSRVATLIGVTDTPLTVGSDGALYFRTEIVPFSPLADPIEYRFVRISANNFVRSYSYDTDFEVAPDGTAHLVSSGFGFSTFRTIDSNGWTRATFLPFGSDPSDPLVDEDGTAYVTAGVTGLFGTQSTRVYTVDGASRTVRSIVGLPGDTVMTADGFGLETFTFDGDSDDGTRTYISRITANSIATSDVIDGRIAGFQLGPDGTAYAPIADPTLDNTPVAVVDTDGNVNTVLLPGTLVVRDRNVRGGRSQSAENLGYVNYTVNGTEYVAVLGPDATVVRTIELPEGATGGTVFFGPDGAAYELVEYREPSGNYVSRQILALSTDTYTSIVPGVAFLQAADVVFGPDGIGYLLVGTPAAYDIDVLGFDAAGDTVIPPSGVTNPALRHVTLRDIEVLAFGPDGTAYLTDRSPAGSGVYALTATGAQKVADLEYSQLGTYNLPTFSTDGTGYVANTVALEGGGFATIVTSFSPPTNL